MRRRSRSTGRAKSGLAMNAAVAMAWALPTALVLSGAMVDKAGTSAAVTRSQAITASARPGSMRDWCRMDGRRAMRTWLSTAPPFCARPVKSSTDTARPSRCAAMPMTAPTVSTPVPPIPVISVSWVVSIAGSRGCGRAATRPASRSSSRLAALRSLPPSTVTKLGQKPSTQL